VAFPENLWMVLGEEIFPRSSNSEVIMANEKNPNQNVQQDQSQGGQDRNRSQQGGQTPQGQHGQQGMDREGNRQQDQSQGRGTQQGGYRQEEISDQGTRRDRSTSGMDKDETEQGDL
jgi:hypothetical protein